jgi:predicted metal-binding membrane protein
MTTAPSPMERIFRRDRAMVAASLAGLTILAWAYLVLLSVEMARGDMSLMGMGGDMASAPQAWSAATVLLMLIMWWVMMIGMMLPSAAPMILLYARVQRKALPGERPVLRTVLFTSGYLFGWLAFSVAATAIQWGLTEAALMSRMMAGTSDVLGALIFASAGIYQLTPLKNACLENCRSPIQFLSAHWRKGLLGAGNMGLVHGAYCVGCCWFLMALLFVGGVMNLLWVAVIAAVVLIEKVMPYGVWLAQAGGVAMIGYSVLLIVKILI